MPSARSGPSRVSKVAERAPEGTSPREAIPNSSGREPRWELVPPGSFAPERHFYPRVLNAQIHSMVRFFLSLSNERIVSRYVHLHPRVDAAALAELLAYQPRYFRWAGADLFHVTTEDGARKMVVVETNSCPSGQKSMPLYEELDEQGGYRVLLERSFAPLLERKRLPNGELAVIYDKNPMEASGYAAAMADLFDEPVHLVEFPDGATDPRCRFEDGTLLVRDADSTWRPIRCAFRYVTQRPWNRIPVATKTMVLNPVFACLSGGRNKMIAAKAYDLFNAEIASQGLEIQVPETMWDVHRREVPFWVKRLGGHAVVKVPYSNAGQGVFTITNAAELDAFMKTDHRYDRFVVQSLIGNVNWSSTGTRGRLYHVGTVPSSKGLSYVADLRCMVSAGPDGFRPLVVYARRAREPLADVLASQRSWDVLGTNLSIRLPDGGWGADTERLLLMDRKDFNALGLGIDELIEGYIQTVLAAIAIDKMAIALTSKRGTLRLKTFRSLNDDDALISEILESGGVETSG